MKPKYLIIIIALLAAIWSAFWFFAVSRFEEALDVREETLSKRGIGLQYSARKTGGFPFRLIATYADFQATGAGSGFGWGVNGARAHVVALPWNSHHAILDVADAGVVLSSDWQNARDEVKTYATQATAASLRMSVSAKDSQLQRISLQLRDVDGESRLFGMGPFDADDLQFHLRWPVNPPAAPEDLEAAVQLEPALRIKNLHFKGRTMGALGPTLDSLVMQSAIRGPEVPGRSADELSYWRLNGGTLDVPLFQLDWGPMHVTGDGTVAIDEQFRPIGAFSLQAQGLDAALATLEADTRISSDAAEFLRITLGALGAGEAGETIPVPVMMQNGIVSIGPVGIVETGSLQVRP